MAVTGNSQSPNYVINGVGPYEITFKFLADSDVKTFLNGEEFTASRTITGAGDDGGGQLTFSVAPEAGAILSIQRGVPYDQQNFQPREGDSLPARTLENAIDRNVMQTQQLADLLESVPKAKPGDTPPGGSFKQSPDTTQGQDSNGDLIARTAEEERDFLGVTDLINELSDGTGILNVESLTGDVIGNVTGDVTGDVTGNVTGNLTGNSAGVHTGAVTGNLTGNVTGNVAGNSSGVHTGDVTGDVTGDLTGNVTGDLTGNVTGDLTGDVTGSHVNCQFVTTGLVTGVNGTFSQTVTATDLVSTNGYFVSVSAQSLSATGITINDGSGGGDVSAVSGTFSGTVTADSIVVPAGGNISTVGGTIFTSSGSISSTSGNISTTTGDINAVSGNVNAGADVTAVDGIFSGDVTADSIVVPAGGNISTVGGTIFTSSGSISSTSGNISTTTGDINAVSGNVNAGADVTAVDGIFSGNVSADGGDSTEWNAAYTDRTPFSIITGTGGQTHIRYKSDGWLKSEIDAIDTSFGSSDIEAVIFGPEVPTGNMRILKNQVGLKFVNFGEIEIIPFEACQGCAGLERVIMRAIDQIGQHAFNGCSSLTDVDLGSVANIGGGGFKNCASLTSVTIPASVTSIGNNAFDGCSLLSEVNCYANNSVFSTSTNLLKNTASPLTIHARPNTGWGARESISFQGNPNVTIILDLE